MIPKFLYGTAWKEEETTRCVEEALRAGFRAIDTANQRKHYFEAAVGEAVKNFNRKELFLQTKFTYQRGQDHRLPYDPKSSLTEQVRTSFESSLSHLHTDYVDSYVLHGPASGFGLTPDDWEVWAEMEELHREGKAKVLGVSNVNIDQLRALQATAKIKPTFVQNRCFARTGWDKEVRAFCTQNKITYQGFSLLTANVEIFRSSAIIDVYTRNKCTPAQAVFAFARQIGMLPLTGTTDPEHMTEDLESLNLELSAKDLETIERASI